MAMTLLSAAPDVASLDVRILATDIDPNMVSDARAGLYAEGLMAGVSDEHRRRWTAPAAGRPGFVQMSDETRALITFNELNLIGDWPMKGPFDAIFCRNVVIYFEEETQARVWSRFKPLLTREGRLYIGHSERLNGPAAAAFVSDGLTTYRFAEGAGS